MAKLTKYYPAVNRTWPDPIAIWASWTASPGRTRRTKWLAEQEVVAAVTRGQDVFIVSITVPVGPWDVKPTPSGRSVLDFIRRRIPVSIGVHLNLLEVADVVQGHTAAWRHGRSRERFLLGNCNTTLPEAAYVEALLEGLVFRRPPYIPLESAGLARQRMAVDYTRAISELGLLRSSIAGAPLSAVCWFYGNGYA